MSALVGWLLPVFAFMGEWAQVPSDAFVLREEPAWFGKIHAALVVSGFSVAGFRGRGFALGLGLGFGLGFALGLRWGRSCVGTRAA